MHRPKLIAISGSLRKASISTAVLRALAKEAGARAEVRLLGLAEVPLYNADLDGPLAPEPVRALRAETAACDGMVICTPEYNYGVPGVLKNALDWLSRPAYASPLKGKPVLAMSAAPGVLGGVRAQHQLRDTLFAALARVVVRPDIVIASGGEKMRDGAFDHAPSLAFALAGLDDLLTDIARLRGAAADGACNQE